MFAALGKEQIGHENLFTPTVWPYAFTLRLTEIISLISFPLLLGSEKGPEDGMR